MNSSSLLKSTHIWSQCVCRLPNNFEIFSEWVLSVMVWLSKPAAAARLSVCFPLVLYLPHGQNMALAFNKTKLVLCVAMSASLELIIIIWNWKAATPSFFALTLITNKFSFRNLCVCVWIITYASQNSPFHFAACQQLFLVCAEAHLHCLIYFPVSFPVLTKTTLQF